MEGQGKITIVIKRAPVQIPSAQHAVGFDVVRSPGDLPRMSPLPDYAQAPQHLTGSQNQKEAERSRRRPVWWQPGSWAIAAGLAFAALAAASVVKLTDTLALKVHLTTHGRKPQAFEQMLGPSLPAERTASGDISTPTTFPGPSASHEVKQADPPQEAPVLAPRRAQAPRVRPKFPDAFRGEVQVHEQVIARPKKRSPHLDAVQPEQFPDAPSADARHQDLGQEGPDGGLPD
ncbi:MAG: hypothetical protein C4293_15075 [Nitrospiraceae bacterium]